MRLVPRSRSGRCLLRACGCSILVRSGRRDVVAVLGPEESGGVWSLEQPWEARRGEGDNLDDDEEEEGAVHVIHALQPGGHSRKRIPRCSVSLAGHKIQALINTGASINVLVQPLLTTLPIQPKLQPTSTQVYSFGLS
ncbi:hypothetical protein NDU88_002158 [Pleurodeles waltl]|uniref:Peptidase A2 domain-containing protein n=1 Tax=Pleurodeles waltl TaxID=8319 RepID=A0AAV7SE34_PLEWA|nr:hypothetical protein NDU88_002158 [Pleurodeles waltl]